ncbi:MAG TPA: hypothetical protein VHK69_22645, partial [Chitinophagaceae bacterium]|nr:hypothetical protein [Chitinophagaceae bacterium]
LPADRYAFLYYFKDPSLQHSFPPGLMGALEHQTSSFYYLPEVPAQQLRSSIVDISSHEFQHIITPLNIASREVKEFNFIKPVLSQHLWLYEGVTEYTAHHIQVVNGLNPVPQFLSKLSAKITNSRTQYNDTLSFTTMSRESAGKYHGEYGNVYEKGALIAAVLDVYLLHLSNGHYGLKNLTHDLGVRYGKNNFFEDEALFAEIGRLTYPEIEAFLRRHVSGSEPIPYESYFGLAGIRFTPKTERKVPSFGGFAPVPNKQGIWTIGQQSKFNDFGKKMGYQPGDELYAINGVRLTQVNLPKVIDSLKSALKEGDQLTVRVGRTANGRTDTLNLSAPLVFTTETSLNKLEPMTGLSAQQQRVQQAWLNPNAGNTATASGVANPADVASVDAMVKAVYAVITGPAGPRDWNRFHGLFQPGAKMGAMADGPNGFQFIELSPAQYQKSNEPFFLQSGFYEEELGRTVQQFGNIAQVQSAYQFRMEPNGPVAQRGINYITLVKNEGRWWISSLVWQEEGGDLKIPADLLKKTF